MGVETAPPRNGTSPAEILVSVIDRSKLAGKYSFVKCLVNDGMRSLEIEAFGTLLPLQTLLLTILLMLVEVSITATITPRRQIQHCNLDNSPCSMGNRYGLVILWEVKIRVTANPRR